MSARAIAVVGDALLDRDLEGRVERLCPEAPVPVVDELATRSRPGGAGLAASLLAADGMEVTLITALARDAAGEELAALLETAGVRVVDLGLDGATPEKIRVRSDGTLLLRIDHGGRRPTAIGALRTEGERVLTSVDAVLVSDYGRGVSDRDDVRAAVETSAREVPVVWDPHPRGREPVRAVRLVTPNASEANDFAREVEGAGLRELVTKAQLLRVRWAAGVAVTLGANGALLVDADGSDRLIPAPPVVGGDPCGAGDRFASSAAGSFAQGRTVRDAVEAAVREASDFVAAGGASSFQLERAAAPLAPPFPDESAEAVIARVRAAGGTVVATGGCFDLLHAGHIATLEAARALGDCLVVCLNSDASVRHLKGAGRPVVSERDRATVLSALSCVDAVAVFDETTPAAILEHLRPDIWAKGGDYTTADLPEAAVLARWGGEVVILPYVDGHSTTRLLEEMVVRGGA